MKKTDLKFYLFFLLTIVLAIVFFSYTKNIVFGSDTVVTTVKISVCGNGIQEYGEQCDGNDFAGLACSHYGFNNGSLSCDIACDILTTSCFNTTPPPSGGGGGGGITPPPAITGINISGRAFPMSSVTVLKDGQIAATTIAGPDANFAVQLTGLSAGSYNLSVYGTDSQGRRSALFNFSVFVNIGAVSYISGIFITPTIAVDKSEVKHGDNIAIFGQTVPSSLVTVKVNSAQEFFEQTNADNNGDLVLDCFAGSGTTLIAAQSLNRNWIGIDKSEQAIKVAKKKLSDLPNSLFSKVEYEFLKES